MEDKTIFQKQMLSRLLREYCAYVIKVPSETTGEPLCRDDCSNCHSDWSEREAEFLINRGVFALPVPEGTPIYCDGKYFAPHCAGEIHKVEDWFYSPVFVEKDFRGETDYRFDIDSYNKTWFSSREALENSIRKNGERN